MTLLAALGLLSLAAWVYLTAFRHGYWRGDQRLSPRPVPLDEWPAVVAIIPARDEAAAIGATIAAHMASDYPGALSVIMVDDHSTDGTAEIATRAAAGDPRLKICQAPPLAPGWSGKLAALHHGLARAREIAPDAKYLLLTDADILHAPDTLRRLVAKAEREELSLVSLMARLDSRGGWGELLIPAFVYFFQKLYPFAAANDPRNPLAAAAGGCMLVAREALEAEGGVASIRGALIDDCTLAALIKGRPPKRRIWLGLTRQVRSQRDNRSLKSIWDMVARTAYAQLDHSPLRLAGTVLGMGLLYIAPPALALAFPLHGDGAAALAGLGAWALMTLSYGPTAKLYDQPVLAGAALPVSATLYTLMTISSALRHWRGEGGKWKGRTYPWPDKRH